MKTILRIEIVESYYTPCWPSGVSVTNYVTPTFGRIIPEPYQAGDCPFRAYPPLGWEVNEADLFWRDHNHDHGTASR